MLLHYFKVTTEMIPIVASFFSQLFTLLFVMFLTNLFALGLEPWTAPFLMSVELLTTWFQLAVDLHVGKFSCYL